MVNFGGPAVCPGTVMHHRTHPSEHRFTSAVSMIWIDPDEPEALFGHHGLWSSSRPAPIRFRRNDYLDGGDEPIGTMLRQLVADELGHRPEGAVRMLTQPRTWGWLFNPITVYLLWDGDAPERGPVAAVLEVTNTPWKERHIYAIVLTKAGHSYTAQFDKILHVSPFLGEHFTYRLSVTESGPERRPRLAIDLDVFARPDIDRSTVKPDRIQSEPADGDPFEAPVLRTRLVVDRHPVSHSSMTKALLRNPFPTHRVSLGIHRHAFTLWRKKVPFVSHSTSRRASGEARQERQ